MVRAIDMLGGAEWRGKWNRFEGKPGSGGGARTLTLPAFGLFVGGEIFLSPCPLDNSKWRCPLLDCHRRGDGKRGDRQDPI